jgi:putative RecB family exonuclease
MVSGSDPALVPPSGVRSGPVAGPGGEPSGARPPGPPTGLSPSRASDFMRCPLLYRLRVIDRLPEKPSEAATRGTVVHAVLERLFDSPAPERTAERARGMVAEEWHRLLAERPELETLFGPPLPAQTREAPEAAAQEAAAQEAAAAREAQETTAAEDSAARAARLAEWLRSAERLVERWFTLEDPTRLEPAERELYVRAELDSGLVLRGYVDRLDVAPGSGALRVVDYKTGRAPRPEYADEALFQMRFYALVLWRLRGVVPRRLQLVYLGSGEVLTHDPTEAELRVTARKVEALWAAIRRATETGDWRPRPGRLCDWCDHRAVCPSFGGTPPPYPLPVIPATSEELS